MKPNRLRRVGAVAVAAVSVALAPIILPAVTLSSNAGAVEQDLGVDDPYETVSADPLPAPSINGVVWDQEVVGNTVYAVGEFTTATTPGGSAVTRRNALAYDITTGALLDWAPSANAAVRSVVASPDGSTIYLGGTFTTINGLVANRVAAVDPRSGTPRNLGLSLNSGVNAVALSPDGSKLYAGGYFSEANRQRRQRVVEFDVASRTVTPFSARVPDYYVHAVATEPGGTGVAIGGAFTSVNGYRNPGNGLAILEAGTGELRYNRLSSVIGASGKKSAVWGMAADARGLYTASYSGAGAFEGVARLNWQSGELEWMLDCHGDSYDVHPAGDIVYISSHEHDCSNVDLFPNNWKQHYNATAVVNQAVGTVRRNTYSGYTNFQGQPATTLLSFFPSFTPGTYTGAHQATWTVEGNDDYIVYGGEFTAVNGQQQQGLVRFAKRSIAPNQVSAHDKGGAYKFSARSTQPGVVSFSWKANWDSDDRMLTYEIFRDTTNSKPVWTRKVASTFWDLPELTATDFVDPGSQHRYRIRVTDKYGASTQTDWVTITAKDGVGLNALGRQAAADGAVNVWSMDEGSGRDVADSLGNINARLYGWGWERAGEPATTSGSSTSFGTAAYAVSQQRIQGPQTFSLETWVRTTSRSGGLLLGFGSSYQARSSQHDRQLYLRTDGVLVYGLYPGRVKTLESSQPINDGKWHHVVATTSEAGSVLYVDGQAVSEDTSMNQAEDFQGYWHIGGDNLRGFPRAPRNIYLEADIDDVAIYNNALVANQVRDHYALGQGKPANQAPQAALTLEAAELVVSADASGSQDPDGKIASYKWSWGDGTAEETTTAATAKHAYAAAGTYTVRVTVTDDGGQSAQTEQSVTVKVAEKPVPPVAPEAPNQPGAPGNDVPMAGAFRATFDQDVAAGWGEADKGGTWSTRWGGSALSVANGAGRMSLARAGSGSRVSSPALEQADADLTASFQLEALPSAGRIYIDQDLRATDAGSYRVKLQVTPEGTGKIELLKVVGGSEQWLSESQLPTIKAGETVRLRFSATGTSTTTVAARLWTGQTEPKDWNVIYKDSAQPLTQPGAISLTSYLSRSETPVTIAVDEIRVG